MKVEQEALFLQLWDKLGFYSQTCFSTRRNVCALQLKGAVLFTLFFVFPSLWQKGVHLCVCVCVCVCGGLLCLETGGKTEKKKKL